MPTDVASIIREEAALNSRDAPEEVGRIRGLDVFVSGCKTAFGLYCLRMRNRFS